MGVVNRMVPRRAESATVAHKSKDRAERERENRNLQCGNTEEQQGVLEIIDGIRTTSYPLSPSSSLTSDPHSRAENLHTITMAVRGG